jgi:hypothetical protein
MERNDAGGYYSCCVCGAVSDLCVLGDGYDIDLHKYRESAPYNALYHFNEVWSAYLGRGPLIEEWDFELIRHYLCSVRVSEFNARRYKCVADVENPAVGQPLQPLLMERVHWHQLCKEVGLPQLSERWIQIKKRICSESFVMRYPTPSESNSIRACFIRFANAFTQRYYHRGKRRTKKDNVVNNIGFATRHNMPHYNWIIQNIMNHLDKSMLARYEADRYFPLQKTPAVRRKLRHVWGFISDDLGWETTVL